VSEIAIRSVSPTCIRINPISITEAEVEILQLRSVLDHLGSPVFMLVSHLLNIYRYWFICC
jgi:hypothetical protein